MNRREFLTRLMMGAAASVLPPIDIDRLLRETATLDDDAFVAYVTMTARLYCDNPRRCGVITNIGG